MNLKPWYKVATPREDLRENRPLDASEFAVHLDQVREQLGREPRRLPRLNILRRPDTIYDYCFEDFELVDYFPHAHIAAPVAV